MEFVLENFSESGFRKAFADILHIPATIFVDRIPSVEQLSQNPINIMVHQEPDEYLGVHHWSIYNKDLLSLILTWDEKVLNLCPQADFMPFGHTWLTPEQINTQREQRFELAHLCGKLKLTYGHEMRHEILYRQNEINIAKNFFHTIGKRYDIPDARKGKETVFASSQFGIAIENTSHRGYFTEKILDCFLFKTIPFYWGCSNISDFFDEDGIIFFNNPDDLIYKANNLDENYYQNREEVVEKNFQLAQQYTNYAGNICQRVKEIFAHNYIS